MCKFIKFTLALHVIYLINWSAFALETKTLEVRNPMQPQILMPYVEYYEDDTSKLDVGAILSGLRSNPHFFQKVKKSNFGYTNSAIWIKLLVRNTSSSHQNLAIELFDFVATRIDLYTFKNLSNGLPKNDIPYSVQKSGSSIPISLRLIEDREFLFEVSLKPGEEIFLLLRFKSHQNLETNGLIADKDLILHLIKAPTLGLSIYFGMIIALFLYNLVLWIFIRDYKYGLYLFWEISVGILFWGGLGFGDQYTPLPGGWSEYLPAIRPLVMVGGWIFVLHYIDVKIYLRRWVPVFYTMAGVFTILVLLAIGPYKKISGEIFDNLVLVSFIAFIIFSIISAYRGARQAFFFLYSWIPMMLGIVVWYLLVIGIVPANPFTLASVPIGNALEMIIIALGLADRINSLQQKLVATLQESKEHLEERVELRTRELQEEIKHKELAQIELKKSQESLIQTSKMTSLGIMAAGVAHEINNPLAAIQLYAETIERVMDLEPNVEDNLRLKISGSTLKLKETVKRISDIVQGLRSLSREDSDLEKEDFRLSFAINDVLAICSEKFKYRGISFEANIDDELWIHGQRTQVGQVVLNLINNSFDAIRGLEEGWIKLTLTSEDHVAKLRVIDSGKGILPNVLESLFEPFVSTKSAQGGVGLGLSISMKIVEQHNGKLYYEKYNGNTSFVVELPLVDKQLLPSNGFC